MEYDIYEITGLPYKFFIPPEMYDFELVKKTALKPGYDFTEPKITFEEFRKLSLEEKKNIEGTELFTYWVHYKEYSFFINKKINICSGMEKINYRIQGLEIYNFNIDAKIYNLLEDISLNYPKYDLIKFPMAKGIFHFINNKVCIEEHCHKSKYAGQFYSDNFVKNYKNIPEIYDLMCRFVKFCNLAGGIETNKNIEDFNIALSKHEDNMGIYSHIDNMTKSDKNVYVLNLGATIYYDMYPIFTAKTDKMMRIKIKSGQAIILRDSARIEWTHGIPDLLPGLSKRFALLYKN